MNLILNQPYKLIWMAIPLVMGLALIKADSTIDIPLHDIYFLVASAQVGIQLSLTLGFNGCLYWLLRKKKLVNWMTAFHVITTILSFNLIIITGFVFKDFNQIVPAISLLLMPVSQLIFFVNLAISLIRNEEKFKR